MQEAMPAEPVGSNGSSLQQARQNFTDLGAISKAKLAEVEPDGPQKYPRQGGDAL